jgi:hypothetical protein
MRTLFVYLSILLLVGFSLGARGQKREPLTQAQADQIADLGDRPPDRIRLYIKFLDERAEVIKGLTNRAASAARSRRLDDELQNFTALMDELASNLDEYGDRKADLRTGLKPLTDATPRWLNVLRALAGDSGFAVARKEAIECGEDLDDQAKRLLAEQTTYFSAHKDRTGQDREEPQ